MLKVGIQFKPESSSLESESRSSNLGYRRGHLLCEQVVYRIQMFALRRVDAQRVPNISKLQMSQYMLALSDLTFLESSLCINALIYTRDVQHWSVSRSILPCLEYFPAGPYFPERSQSFNPSFKPQVRIGMLNRFVHIF